MRTYKKPSFITKEYLCKYVVMFMVLSLFIYLPFLLNGKTLIRTADGLNQYFYSLCYYGEYLRNFLYHLFSEGKVVLPMWDMHIGYGADVLTTLNYYAIGDPLYLLTVFFEQSTMEYCFVSIFFIRVFLSGVTFSVFSLRHGNSKNPTLVASILYAFCGYALFLVPQYLSFAIPLVYFPVVLVGADKVLEKKKPYHFIFAIALCAVANFYFFYMTTIFMIIYVIYRYCYITELKLVFAKRGWIKEIGGWILKFAAYYTIGLLISMPVLLPVIIKFLDENRNAADYPMPIVYNLGYYIEVLIRLCFASNGSYLGVGVILLPVLVLIINRKKTRIYQVFLFMIIIMMMFPIFGSLFNGMAYVTDRWHWVLAMSFCYLIARFFDATWEFGVREKIQLTVLAGGLAVLSIVAFDGFNIAVFVSIILLLGIYYIPNDKFGSFKKKAIGFVSFCGVVVFAYSAYLSVDTNDSYLNYVSKNTAGTAYLRGDIGIFMEYLQGANIENNSLGEGRFEKSAPYEMYEMNSAMLMGINGTQYYFSLYDQPVANFYNDLQINAINDFRIDGVNSRGILLNLLNVEYVLGNTQQEIYGYSKVCSRENMAIYQSDNVRSLGYTYNQYISKEVWDKLSAVEKQYALLQGCVVEGRIEGMQEVEPAFSDLECAYTEVITNDNVLIIDNGWNVKSTDAEVVLAIVEQNIDMHGEYYVLIEGLEYLGEHKNSKIKFCVDEQECILEYLTPYDNIYTGKHDFLINLGYYNVPLKEIVVSFERVGEYRYDNVRVICQPMDKVEEYIERMHEEVLKDVCIGNDIISGNIVVSEDKLLCMAIPYSDGWSAYVDGVETNTYIANDMMIAVLVEAGEHEIVLKYTTPGFKMGCIMSILGMGILVVVVLGERQKESVNYFV